MAINEEQIEEIIKAVKNNGDLSVWKKDRKAAGFVNLLSELSGLPKAQIPRAEWDRVRNQILDRIAIPQVVEESGFLARLSAFAPYIRIAAGGVASLLVVVSLSLGVAVAALGSAPGSSIYPLKKIVENIELKLAPADQKGTLQLKFAVNRAEELQQVLDKKQEGKISDQEASAIISTTVKDLQATAAAAVNSTKSQAKSSALVTKLGDISNKLRAASVLSEGLVKIELEKAAQSTKISQEQAIKNMERAGLKVENAPIAIEETVKASGKLTSVSETTVSIGSVKFLITEDTKFVGLTAKDLKIGLIVDVNGQIKDNKSYAQQIKLVTETKTETPATDPKDESQ